MQAPFLAFLSGDAQDVAQAAAALYARGIRSAYIGVAEGTSGTMPEYCPPATPGFNPAIILELTNSDTVTKRARVQTCQQFLSLSIPLLTSSVIISATEQATWVTGSSNLIGFSYLTGQFGRKLLEIAPTVHTDRTIITAVEDFIIRLGKEISVVQDRVGMVLPRVLSALVNEAFFAVMEGAAGPQDIDTAMKLGTSYPQGPVEWGHTVGLHNVVAILDALYRDTGEDRYRVAPLLRQMALGQIR